MKLPIKTARELRHQVAIHAPTVTNTDGESTTTWATFARPWAQIIPRGSFTRYQAQQVQPETTHIVRIRYRDGVTSEMRLMRGARILHIVGPPRRIPDDVPWLLEMECKESE